MEDDEVDAGVPDLHSFQIEADMGSAENSRLSFWESGQILSSPPDLKEELEASQEEVDCGRF